MLRISKCVLMCAFFYAPCPMYTPCVHDICSHWIYIRQARFARCVKKMVTCEKVTWHAPPCQMGLLIQTLTPRGNNKWEMCLWLDMHSICVQLDVGWVMFAGNSHRSSGFHCIGCESVTNHLSVSSPESWTIFPQVARLESNCSSLAGIELPRTCESNSILFSPQ